MRMVPEKGKQWWTAIKEKAWVFCAVQDDAG